MTNQKLNGAIAATLAAHDPNDPAVLDEKVAEFLKPLIQQADPRNVLRAVLSNAAGLAELILNAERATPGQIATVFGAALVDALTPSAEEAPRIEVIPGGILPRV